MCACVCTRLNQAEKMRLNLCGEGSRSCARASLPSPLVWACARRWAETRSARRSCCASLSPCCAPLRTSSSLSLSGALRVGVCVCMCVRLSVGLRALNIDFLTSFPAQIVTPRTGRADFTICISPPPPPTATTSSPLSVCLALSIFSSSPVVSFFFARLFFSFFFYFHIFRIAFFAPLQFPFPPAAPPYPRFLYPTLL